MLESKHFKHIFFFVSGLWGSAIGSMEENLKFIRGTTFFLLSICSNQLFHLLKLSTYFSLPSSNTCSPLVANRNAAMPNRRSTGTPFVLLPAFSRIPSKIADSGLKYIYAEWQE